MRAAKIWILTVACMVCGMPTAHAATALLTWDAPPAEEMVTGWKIYYDRDQSGAPYDGTEADQGPSPIDVPLAAVADPSMPTLELTGLESCVSYWVAATAYNDAGESDFSEEVEKKVVAAPEDLAATSVAPGEVTLTWVAPPVGDPGTIPNFQIFYDLDGPGEPYSGAGSPFGIPAMNEVVISDLTTRATYWFVVDSVCDNFASKRSDEVSVVVAHEFPTNDVDMGTPTPLPTPDEPEMDMGAEQSTTPEAPDGGCGCTSTGGSTDVAWLGFVVAAASIRRRKRLTSRDGRPRRAP